MNHFQHSPQKPTPQPSIHSHIACVKQRILNNIKTYPPLPSFSEIKNDHNPNNLFHTLPRNESLPTLSSTTTTTVLKSRAKNQFQHSFTHSLTHSMEQEGVPHALTNKFMFNIIIKQYKDKREQIRKSTSIS
jgi:hypothetical protein